MVGVFQIAAVWIIAGTLAICCTASISGAHLNLNPAISINAAANAIASARAFGEYYAAPVTTAAAFFAEALALGSAVLAGVIFALTHPGNDTMKHTVYIPPFLGLTVGGLITVIAPHSLKLVSTRPKILVRGDCRVSGELERSAVFELLGLYRGTYCSWTRSFIAAKKRGTRRQHLTTRNDTIYNLSRLEFSIAITLSRGNSSLSEVLRRDMEYSL
jgi:hypothetical protein